jgi:hypothetical protein
METFINRLSTLPNLLYELAMIAAQGLSRVFGSMASSAHAIASYSWAAYVVGVVGFILCLVLGAILFRLAAYLVIILCLFGGAFVVCLAIHEGYVRTWEELAWLIVGAAVCLVPVATCADLVTQAKL